MFDTKRHGIFNLLTIYQAISGESEERIVAHFSGKGYGDLKREVADLVIATLEPIQSRYREITEDPAYIPGLLEQSVDRLRPIVDDTMSSVRAAMGFS